MCSECVCTVRSVGTDVHVRTWKARTSGRLSSHGSLQSAARRGLHARGAFALWQCVHTAPDMFLPFQQSGAAYGCSCRVSSPLPLTRAQCPHDPEVMSSPVFPHYPASTAPVLPVDAPVLDVLNKCSHTAVLPCVCFLRSDSAFRGRVVACVGTPSLVMTG